MAGYITRGQEKSVVLSAAQVDTLVRGGSGDAALLYLLLQRLDGPVTPEALAEKLRWIQLRCAAAVSTPAPIRQNRIQQATTPRRIT